LETEIKKKRLLAIYQIRPGGIAENQPGHGNVMANL
jgi:hypothetical protein